MSRSAAEFQAFLELQRQEYRDALPDKVNAIGELWSLAQLQPDLLGDLERRAHGMAGTAGTLGLGALGDLARALELAVRTSLDAGSMTPASHAAISAALAELRSGLPPPPHDLPRPWKAAGMLRFRAKINVTLILGMVLILCLSVGAFFAINSLLAAARHQSDVQESALQLERLVSNLNGTESRQRKYLITRNPGDLPDYGVARSSVAASLASLRGTLKVRTSENTLRALESAIDKRLALLDSALRAGETSGLDAARDVISSEANRALRTEFEQLVQTLKDEETRAYEGSRATTRSTAYTIELLILAAGLLSVGLMCWAIYVINRHDAERKRAQVRLSDSEAMSRAVTESIAEGVITTTPDGRIVNMNAAAQQLFGYSVAELRSRPLAQLLPERYREVLGAFMDALALRPPGFREHNQQLIAQRKNGSEFPVNVSFGDVTGAHQRLFTAIIRDETDRERTSQAIRASETQLTQITNNVPALIACVDLDGRFQFHNKAYEECFGLTGKEIRGNTLREVMGDAYYARIEDKVMKVLSGEPVRYERSHVTPAGVQRDYDMSYFPRYGEEDEEGQVVGFYSLGTDITDLKRIDRMKTEFVSTVSHELRTPLTSIRGSLGLVAGGMAGKLPAMAENLVGIAKNNCERLIRLINDILDSEKIESGQMRFDLQVHDIAPLLEDTIVANEGFAAQHNVRFLLHLPPETLRVNIDSDRVAQVITNLLSNAAKFSPPGSSVDVHVRSIKRRVRVEVSDSGPGISEAFRKRIFQKFSQADSSDTRQKGGTGLGLNISRAIIERMGGSIGFSTEEGIGTTFFFELPQWREAAAMTVPGGLMDLPRSRVLVCEDDPDIARLIAMMLDKGGFDCDTAHSASQALAHLQARSYAAMTVDLALPDQHGAALIRVLRRREETRNLPIVVVSAGIEEGQMQFNNQPLAVTDWLHKPIDENMLVNGVRRAIDGMRTRPRILHVEDDPDIQRIAAAIAQDFATFDFATTLDEARLQLQTHRIDLILLDLNLGETSGWDLFADIDALHPAPPVVVFSASEISDAQRRRVSAVLLKAQTTNAQLLATLQRVLNRSTPRAAAHASNSSAA